MDSVVKPAHQIQAEFDRIARLSSPDSDALGRYEEHLLRHAPAVMSAALEIGCGTGAFARRLAERAKHVTAIDVSPGMIEAARLRSARFSNIDYVLADATAVDFPAERFDCVAAIATLHHVPLRPMLDQMIDALAPRGVLLVLDLVDAEGIRHLPRNALAWIVARMTRERPTSELAQAWEEHGRGEKYVRFAEIEALAAERMPGAKLRHHLLWRYSIVWTKPGRPGVPIERRAEPG